MRGLFALLLLVGACGESKEPAAAMVSGPTPPHLAAPRNLSDAARAPFTSPVPAEAKQILVTVTDDWTATNSDLFVYERISASAPWRLEGSLVKSTIGKTGLAWGRGLHEIIPAALEPIKREGDGKSPAGVFAIGSAYGYEDAPSDTSLAYQKSGADWRCVNDSASRYYNRVIDSSRVEKDWNEAEIMRRKDELYRLVIEVDHNHIVPSELAPVSQGGSCIFLHVWRKAGAPTIGCTAMSLADMKSLMAWLDPGKEPHLIALPRARYESLRAEWDLPTLPQ